MSQLSSLETAKHKRQYEIFLFKRKRQMLECCQYLLPKERVDPPEAVLLRVSMRPFHSSQVRCCSLGRLFGQLTLQGLSAK